MCRMADSRQGDTCAQGRLTRVRKRLAAGKGQALVEFAFVLPLIMLLILGVIDFGRAFNYQNNLSSLANQAVRYAEVNSCAPCNGQSIQDYIRGTADSNELQNGSSGIFGVRQPGLCIAITAPTSKFGDPIKAKASVSYNWLPFLHLAPVTISATVTGRQEQAYTLQPTGTVTSSNYSGSCP